MTTIIYDTFMNINRPISIIGFVGQACFFSRFLVQWIASERKHESTIPVIFWYFSIMGGILVFIYAFLNHDPVIMLGQSCGIFIYIRNMMLMKKKRKEQ
ncbi:lipid-A-disaccharide synthase N-terminal domain-containing protein [Thermodesulfobacteriota bacterium]